MNQSSIKLTCQIIVTNTTIGQHRNPILQQYSETCKILVPHLLLAPQHQRHDTVGANNNTNWPW
jgi:hypothetical protein